MKVLLFPFKLLRMPFRVFGKAALWGAGVLVGLIIVVVIIVAVATGGSGSEQEQGSAVAGMGEPVRTANWEVVVPSSPSLAQTLGEGFTEEEAAGKFVIVPISITNVGNQGSTFSDWQLKLVDEQGREFDSAEYSVQAAADSDLFLKSINPGNTYETVVVFDVPDEPLSLDLKVEGSVLSRAGRIDLGAVSGD